MFDYCSASAAEAYSQAIERKLKAGGSGSAPDTSILDSLEKEKQDLVAQLQKQRADLAGMCPCFSLGYTLLRC